MGAPLFLIKDYGLSLFLMLFLPPFSDPLFMGIPFSYIAPFKSSESYTC